MVFGASGGLPVLKETLFSILEQCFRAFLRCQVEQSDLDLAVTYMPTFSATSPTQTFFSRSFRNSSPSSTFNADLPNCITVKITTPLFYSAFAYNPSPFQFFTSTFTPTTTKQQPQQPPKIIHVSNPDLFLALFTPSASFSQHSTLPAQPSSLSAKSPHHLTWHLICFLRSLSLSSKPHHHFSTPPLFQSSTTTISNHPLDAFVAAAHNPPFLLITPDIARGYRTALLKLLLCRGSNPFLLDIFIISILRIVLYYVYASAVRDLLAPQPQLGPVLGLGLGLRGGKSLGVLAMKLFSVHIAWMLERWI